MASLPLARASDCHVHVVGPSELFPQSESRSYTAAEAPLEGLRELAEPEGVGRFVVVQPSFYGTDNACLLACLAKLGDKGRGVAVLDPAGATTGWFETHARRGVCGLRVNLYSK